MTKSGRILYRWRSVPSAANLNGTVARPTAEHVWRAIEHSLNAGDAAEDATHDDHPELDSPPPRKPLFIAALIANGWFIKLKSFAYSPGVASVPKRFAAAFKRWILFVAFWVAAIVILPVMPVLFGFACWVIWIGFDIRRTFSNMGVQQEIKT
ncbi:MAG: hypothetical protein RIC89_07585 [Pseudomonadales bacterium]